MMKMTVQNVDVFNTMEKWAPLEFASGWDNVGLQVGSFNKPVKRIMITLDVLESVVDEAILQKVDLIIAHHPLLFKSMKQVNVDTAQGRIIQKLLQHDISVYASHTNLDTANGGVNDMLCDFLGIENRKLLVTSYTEQLVKLVVYVPTTHVTAVRDVMGENEAGHIGNYSHCTFQTEGTGTFMPLEASNPYIGSQNELEVVNEVKIETIIPKPKLSRVVDAMIEAHPYEEVAYDVYPLEINGKTYGIGRIGTFGKNMNLKELSEHVKEVLTVPKLRVTGDLNKQIKKVAVLGGSGEKYMHAAKRQGADAFITGDMTFHAAQDAWQMGLAVIDPGHHVEKVMKEGTKKYLESELDHTDLEIMVSNVRTEPFQFI